jgi:hypothetical protein
LDIRARVLPARQGLLFDALANAYLTSASVLIVR